MKTLAITGGTGFVGGELIKQAVRDGWSVRALARSPQPAQAGVNWVPGSLGNMASLSQLVSGAQAVIHVAGVVNAPDRAGFAAGNIKGTQAVVDAAKAAGIARFVHVSSLTAREPRLSNYGWSKAEAEQIVSSCGLDWTIVRPPAIYGPRDADMVDLFRMAKWGFVMIPPNGRMSVIEVSDLAALLLTLASEQAGTGQIYEVDDGVPNGWTHRAYALAIGMAIGKAIHPVAAPEWLLRTASRLDRLIRKGRAKLTADRVGYFCHPDWVVDPAKRPASTLWVPRIVTRAGLKQTANAYRQAGWL